MKKWLQDSGFDELDVAILEALQNDGRISVADLARKIHLSQPAVHNRIRRLERQGVIRQYVALLDREIIGYDLLCFVQISFQAHSHEQINTLQDAISQLSPVLECFRMIGNYDLMLKILVRDRKALDAFVDGHLAKLPGVDRIQTSIVLNEVKATTALVLK
jgi:DNA-binding Lrp family transcriptional regulator